MDQKELPVFDALFQDDWNIQCSSCGDARTHFSSVTVQKGHSEIVIDSSSIAPEILVDQIYAQIKKLGYLH